MATVLPVRLLIADASLNRAHEIDSVLRNAGIATRPQFCVDFADAAHAIDTHRSDLVLCHGDLDVLDSILPDLRAHRPDVPIIVLDSKADLKSLTRGLALGATDVVFPSDKERLLYVVRREIDHVCERRRWLQTTRALEEAERRCKLLLANSAAAIAYVHEGMHIYANDDYFKLFGFNDADEPLGVPLLDLIDPEFAEQFKAKLRVFRQTQAELRFDFRGRRVTGEPVDGEMALSGAQYEGEHCMQVLIRAKLGAIGAAPQPEQASSSVEEPGELEMEADIEAPELRGGGIDDFLAEAQDLFEAEGGEGAMLVAEIDDFDALQSEHGIRASESLVSSLGETLLQETNDQAGPVAQVRLATHRFALALPGATRASAELAAERLRKVVAELLLDAAGRTVRCSITLGLHLVTDIAELPSAIDQAFRTLLAARPRPRAPAPVEPPPPAAPKAAPAAPAPTVVDVNGSAAVANGNGNEGDAKLSPQQQHIVHLINRAIETNRFMLLFQPIISLRGDSDEHYEVFLRLLDENGKRLVPDQFLELAIGHGVAGKIDRWVILQSIKLLSHHRSRGHNTRLTINLTYNSLVDQEFLQWLAVAIKAARLPSDAVVFQIAEQDAVAYPNEARNFLLKLRAMHCRSSLRHFGTVEDPFGNLRQLPVDFVKLDGGYVLKMQDSTASKERLMKMIRELQSLGKLTVVPMVESATSLATLWQAGANYIQGHYMQEPSTEMNYDFSSDD